MNWLALSLVATVLISLPPPLETARDRLKCPPRLLKGGRVRIRSKGRVIKYVCLRRYQVLGPKYSTCIRGQWDTPAPICISGGCESVDVANGQVLETYRGAFVTIHCDPGYQLIGTGGLYCNGATWNDTIPYCKEMNVTAQKSCDFESEDLCGWVHGLNHDFDWRRHNFATPSGHVGTGPSFDHTLGPGLNGHYMYLETSSPRLENDTARLFSPVFPAPSSPTTCFIFWYHMYGLTTGSLNVYLHKEDTMLLFSQSGDKGNQWQQAVLPLPSLNSSFQIVIEGVRGAGYEGDTAIDDVKLAEGDECAVTSTSVEANSEANYGVSCDGRCSQVTTDPALCECTADCITNNTCCPDYLLSCSTSTAAIVVTTTAVPQESPLVQRLSLPTTLKTEAPITSVSTTTTSLTSKIFTPPQVTTETGLASSKRGTSLLSTLSTVVETSTKSFTKITSTKSTSRPSLIPSKVTVSTSTFPSGSSRDKIPMFSSTALQPSIKLPTVVKSSTIPYQPTSATITVKSSKLPELSINKSKLPVYSTTSTPVKITRLSWSISKQPATKPRPFFTASTIKPWIPRIKPWIPRTSSTLKVPIIEFVTPPPPIVFRIPTKTMSNSTLPRISTHYITSTDRFINLTSTQSPKVWKNLTKDSSKSRNDVLHPSWSKGSMPVPPPLPTLGPKPGVQTRLTTEYFIPLASKSTKLYTTSMGARPSSVQETKWKSKYKPRDKTPVHAHFSKSSTSSEMVRILVIVVGVLLLLTTVLAAVCIVRRRKINRRSIEDDELDIRFLACDEILDFTIARPSTNESQMYETMR